MLKFNRWVIGHPKTVLALIVLATALFVSQLPKLRPETNLESMFPNARLYRSTICFLRVLNASILRNCDRPSVHWMSVIR